MDEGTGTSKAIPIRRSRGAGRAVMLRPAGWTSSLTAGVRRVLGPPHQLWLASLGGTALTIRGVRAVWSQAVAEGTTVEGWLRRSLGGGTDPQAPAS